MKVEFKQACEIQGKKFGPDAIRRPGIFQCPASFKSDEYFLALVKAGKARIIEDLPEVVEEKSIGEKISDLFVSKESKSKSKGKK